MTHDEAYKAAIAAALAGRDGKPMPPDLAALDDGKAKIVAAVYQSFKDRQK